MNLADPTLTQGFLLLAALSALSAIACESRRAGRHRAFYVLKPLTTLLILGAVLAAPQADPVYRAWVGVGLLLSAAGDTALMWDDDRAFIAGLGSFLVAHVLFVVAFLQHGLAMPGAWVLVPVGLSLAFFVWLLPRTGHLQVPVLVYGLTLLAMSLAAAARWQHGFEVSALWAAIGAQVFLLSDAALAVRRFVRPYAGAQALILSTYWIAIGLIAVSVVGSAALART